jgi:hypothetical protein
VFVAHKYHATGVHRADMVNRGYLHIRGASMMF